MGRCVRRMQYIGYETSVETLRVSRARCDSQPCAETLIDTRAHDTVETHGETQRPASETGETLGRGDGGEGVGFERVRKRIIPSAILQKFF